MSRHRSVAIQFVANLPVFDAIGMAGAAAAVISWHRAVVVWAALVGVLHPAGSFLRRAGAIVDGNHRLRLARPGDPHKGVEGIAAIDTAADRTGLNRIGLPVIEV